MLHVKIVRYIVKWDDITNKNNFLDDVKKERMSESGISSMLEHPHWCTLVES